jgi:hypothetical protein
MRFLQHERESGRGRSLPSGNLIPIRVQKRNFELRFLVWSIKRDKLFRIHSDFENYTLERKLV